MFCYFVLYFETKRCQCEWFVGESFADTSYKQLKSNRQIQITSQLNITTHVQDPTNISIREFEFDDDLCLHMFLGLQLDSCNCFCCNGGGVEDKEEGRKSRWCGRCTIKFNRTEKFNQ
jgi:hypothetical protein